MHNILISIPHCSQHIPEQLRDYILISDNDIKTHSDLYTDEIYTVENASILKATSARVLCDPNRFLKENTMENIYDDGIISSLTPCGEFVFKNLPDEKAIEDMIEDHYLSYHSNLEQIVGIKKIKFIIDAHSMWSYGPSHLKDAGISRPDINIGNRNHTTCTNEQTEFVSNFFSNLGYSVSINNPYHGRSILKLHCSKKRTPGLQIEINRKLYLNEDTLERNRKAIKKFNQEITDLVDEIAKAKNIF